MGSHTPEHMQACDMATVAVRDACTHAIPKDVEQSKEEKSARFF